jgi:GNAT superfamily N-acetyltransferase
MWTLIDVLPGAEDYNCLRQAAGWGVYPVDVIDHCLAQSLYCVCAVDGETVIGMARVVGDGGLVFQIQDVIVLPEYQNQGVGTQLMTAVMNYIRIHGVHNCTIGLMAARGKESFYTRFGFTARPTENLGAGMTQFWQG